MKIIFTSILLFLTTLSFSQNGTPLPAGARGMAMGNTGVSNKDIHSIFSNIAGLGFLEGTQFAIFGDQRFAGTGINTIAIGAAHSVGSGTFGLTIQNFGISDFNEQKIGLSYARKLFDKLSMGVQFDFLNTRIENYGSTSIFTFEIGFLAPINKELTVGARIYSPVRVDLNEDEEVLGLLNIGFSYHPSKKVTLNGEVEKGVDTDLSIKAGVEYQIHPVVSLRVGGASNPTLATFGFGFLISDQFDLDIAATYHQVLGISPGIGIRYGLKNSVPVRKRK